MSLDHSERPSPLFEAGPASPPPRAGLCWGTLGVAAFSFTVPFTRVAVKGGALSPLFVGSGRAVIAAVLAVGVLVATRTPLPRGRQWAHLGLVAGGAVVGFPLLTSFALRTAPASHAVVVIALLPATTAAIAVVRGQERPPGRFWTAAACGAVAAIGFAALQGGGLGGLHSSDLLLFTAVALCAMGYAEGGLHSRRLGSWQTISWALVLAFPLMAFLTGMSMRQHRLAATGAQWASFAYLAVISMFLGFFAWYRGLAIGPMAQVSQVQLAQRVLCFCWAASILGVLFRRLTILGGVAVIGCALLAVRARASA